MSLGWDFMKSLFEPGVRSNISISNIFKILHFDHIIHNYRECQVITNWTNGDNEIEQEIDNLFINKVYNLFSKEINWLPIHILELAESIGGIKPHIDNIEVIQKLK